LHCSKGKDSINTTELICKTNQTYIFALQFTITFSTHATIFLEISQQEGLVLFRVQH